MNNQDSLNILPYFSKLLTLGQSKSAKQDNQLVSASRFTNTHHFNEVPYTSWPFFLSISFLSFFGISKMTTLT